jgi:MerR family transcriptional regulator/heat shock protein HspR
MTCCSAPGVADVMSSPFGLSDDSPVYVISVAAQLAGLHPQTLRYYDKLGLVSPGRSSGRGRRYSLRDVLALREIQRLSQEEGINLSGIKRILELQGDLRRHQQRLTDVSAELTQLRVELESTRSVAARLAGLLRARSGGAQLVPVHDPEPAAGPPVTRPQRRALPIAAGRRPDAQTGPDEGELPAATS